MRFGVQVTEYRTGTTEQAATTHVDYQENCRFVLRSQYMVYTYIDYATIKTNLPVVITCHFFVYPSFSSTQRHYMPSTRGCHNSKPRLKGLLNHPSGAPSWILFKNMPYIIQAACRREYGHDTCFTCFDGHKPIRGSCCVPTTYITTYRGRRGCNWLSNALNCSVDILCLPKEGHYIVVIVPPGVGSRTDLSPDGFVR